MENIGWVEIILGMILSALLGAFIGNQRNRTAAGMILSLFLGPIGWLVILLGPDYRAKCPECKGVIEPDARRCKYCGVEFIKEQQLKNPKIRTRKN